MKSYLVANNQKHIDICAALLVFSLPFSPALPNLFLLLLILLIAFNHKSVQLVKFYPIIFYAAAIIILAVLALFNSSLSDDASMYSRYFLALLLFFVYTQVKNIKYVEFSFVTGTFIAVLISSFTVGNYMFNHPEYLLDVGEKVNKLLLLERPYFGILLFLSVFICLKNAEKSIQKYKYYLLAFSFTAFAIFISARLAIGLCCLLFFIFLFKSTKINTKNKLGWTLGLVTLFAVSMGLSDNLRSRFYLTHTDFSKRIWLIKQGEPRFIIWPCSISIANNSDNLVTGLKSTTNVEQKLTNCYKNRIPNKVKRDYYLKSKFNTHNQFLSFLLLGGIIPALLLLNVFLVTWFSKNSFEIKLIFFLFFAFFMVENVLYRQLGCYLFGIFVALYSSREFLSNTVSPKKQQQTKKHQYSLLNTKK